MSSSNPAGDFDSLARQYWNAWADLARKPEPAGHSIPGWKESLDWWAKLAAPGRDGIDATVERMNSQAGQWFGQLQELAASFAGREAGAADIASAWRNAMGGNGGNPVADMFRRMSGADAHGMEAWLAQVQPFLGTLRGESAAWLETPAFGLAREHQERVQKLVQAQMAYQQRTADYNGQLAKAAKGAFERFEKKLAERSEPGRQLESARALFDLWIDAAEESWAEIALGDEYRRVYGEMVNSQMRLRAAVQGQIEQVAAQLGLPTRSEVNGSHKKLAALEREVRALRQQLAAFDRAPPPREFDDAANDEVAPRPARRPVAKARAVAPARKPAAKKKAAAPARAAERSRKPVLPQVTAPRAAHAPRKPSGTRR
jgi:class III poly(R)-hydroxyalkanoic acid synthase PhaE subunit